VLVLGGWKPEDFAGNLLLDRIFGAETIFAETRDFNKIPDIMEKYADEYRKKGNKPYIVPMGGASGIGSLGYHECFYEVLEQEKKAKKKFNYIVVANGSGGTHSGLETGKMTSCSDMEIIGVSVLFKKEEIVEKVKGEIRETLNVLGIEKEFNGKISLLDEYIGEGYAIPSPLTVEAIKTMGRTEGIVLDPVYTGKAFGGLMDLIGKKRFTAKDRVLFLHTGGYPGIVNLSEKNRKSFV
jgi:1-aminocyclopropane-1-carboxylate deaminase/D-cysteine desulfhydrase-like pyridoxal-dependent ACC family enzyme